MTARVKDLRNMQNGSFEDAPLARVKVGDWVDFKSDIEQSGQIVKIDGNRLHLHNDNGFRGEYLRYAKDTVVYAGDCWI
jgi:hypothetical protein